MTDDERPREYTYFHPLLRRTFRAVEVSNTAKGVRVELVDATENMIRFRTFTQRQARKCLREVA